LKFDPVLDLHYREKNTDKSGNSLLDEKMGLLDILGEKKISELFLLVWAQIPIQVY
jgi:hypothetical protein